MGRATDFNGGYIAYCKTELSLDALPIIAHEILHTVLYSGEYLGFDKPYESHEYFCYMQDWSMKGVIKELKKTIEYETK